ncbi:hypothetical protein TomTYG75_11480 [Sphingobium sp. TomTYG75]
MVPMFGVRLSSLFTSRWMALLWSVLVILTAIQFVGSGDQDHDEAAAPAAASDTFTADQQKAIERAF